MDVRSAPFVAMVEGVEQTYVYDLSIALPGGIYPGACKAAVTRLSIDQSFTSDLPDGTRLIEGYPSATATFALSGMIDPADETVTAEWLFNPYSTNSPLYRQDAFRSPVTIDLGLLPDGAGGTPEVVRKFSGYVDSYTVSTDGAVEFTCIDKRSDLRSVPQLPPVVTAPPFNAGLTSEFAIDYLLRAGTNGAISTWPARRPGVVLAAGMRGSVWPEVGTLGPWNPYWRNGVSYRPGKFGSSLIGPSGIAALNYQAATPVGQYARIEAWLRLAPNVGSDYNVVAFSIGDGDTNLFLNDIYLEFNQSGLYVRSYTTNTTLGPSVADDQIHHVEVLAELPPVGGVTVKVTARIDGVTYGPATLTRTASRTVASWSVITCDVNGASLEALQISTESTLGTSNAGFVPKAVLDPSLNVLQTVPTVGDGDPWQAIQQITQAELGAAGFLADPDTFRFYNRNRLRGGTVARQITSQTSLKELGIGYNAASVVNRAKVGYTGWTFATGLSTIYTSETAIRVPKRGQFTTTVTLDSLASRIDAAVIKMPNGSSAVDSFYRASADYAGLNDFAGALSFTVYQTAPDKLTILIKNATAIDAWLVSPASYTDITAGTPLLRIAGYAVTPNSEQAADWQYPPLADGGAASSRFGEVVHEISGNPWIQDADTAQRLAADIVCESFQPIPDFTGVEIVPDPRLQLADRVQLTDTDETGVDDYARIFAINTELAVSDDGSVDYSMSIDARAVTFPGGWILDVAGRSELGVTTYI